MDLKRRSFLGGLAAVLCAPAIVRIDSIMPVRTPQILRPRRIVSRMLPVDTAPAGSIWSTQSAAGTVEWEMGRDGFWIPRTTTVGSPVPLNADFVEMEYGGVKPFKAERKWKPLPTKVVDETIDGDDPTILDWKISKGYSYRRVPTDDGENLAKEFNTLFKGT